ncbi:transposase, partial [Salmonella enterica]|nr:transposase [Salmonella enterica]
MYVTANDIVGLPGFPGTIQGARKALRVWAGKSEGEKRSRAGSRTIEYHIDCLPAEAQKVLRDHLAKQLLDDASVPAVVDGKASKNLAVRQSLEVMVKCPELALREVQSLTDKQKAIADARILLAAEVHKLRNFG